MGKLSLTSYVWKCVLGAEVVYAICLAGGFLPIRSVKALELHRALFETMPGFTWITPGSVFLGFIYVAFFASIFGSYMVWMYNSSIRNT